MAQCLLAVRYKWFSKNKLKFTRSPFVIVVVDIAGADECKCHQNFDGIPGLLVFFFSTCNLRNVL